MASRAVAKERVFKTAWFSKASRKARITDIELCSAMAQVMLGQADDLGGGVYKKRLGKNLYRSIVVAKGGRFWVYAFLFAKQDRTNIRTDEVLGFHDLAAVYAQKNDEDIAEDLDRQAIEEICHDA